MSFEHSRVEDNFFLEAPFSKEVVKELVWSGADDKSPELDGFKLCFYKECWEVVKGDFVMFVFEFYINAKVSISITTIFLVLISKVDNPQGLDEYRHICVINSLYRILAKFLAFRLKR